MPRQCKGPHGPGYSVDKVGDDVVCPAPGWWSHSFLDARRNGRPRRGFGPNPPRTTIPNSPSCPSPFAPGSLGLVFDQAGFLFGVIGASEPFHWYYGSGRKTWPPENFALSTECAVLFSFPSNHEFWFFSSCISTAFGRLLDKLRPQYMTLSGARRCIYLPNPIRQLIGSFLRLQSRLP